MSCGLDIFLKIEDKNITLLGYNGSSMVYRMFKEEFGLQSGDTVLTRDMVNQLRISMADAIELKTEQCKACRSLDGDNIEYLLETTEEICDLRKAYIQFEMVNDMVYNLGFDDENLYFGFY